jgi:hypothetical protein
MSLVEVLFSGFWETEGLAVCGDAGGGWNESAGGFIFAAR